MEFPSLSLPTWIYHRSWYRRSPVLCDLQLMETSPAAVRLTWDLPRVAASTGGPAVTYGAALIGQGCGRQGPSKSSSGVLVLFLAVLSFL
ncbi:hypothetical protein OUZ56_025571 [Daphnia magna]|uniref:Uncharacterized protein n=1 Tax=Daphnia magna TaxID=35525 RepID=A0ABQ9ZK89_9CRUS|nr:hypothetical protein OUZ56_025571 [Daphnia magna]